MDNSKETRTPGTLNGKVAIVTGAGQGIGYAISERLALEGASVILNDLDEGLAKTAAERIAAAAIAGTCIPVPGDASDPQIIEAMLHAARENFGRLDIGIANAGITLFGDFLSYPAASFDALLKVNLAGTFFLAQAAANQMISQGQGGSLVFMSSVTAHQAHKDLAAYSMSKAAIEMLARNLVIELSPHQINVNTVAPGATLTGRTLDTAGYEQRWAEITPMGRAAIPADIAGTVLFLVSGQARQITGQCIVVDGGWTSVSPSP